MTALLLLKQCHQCERILMEEFVGSGLQEISIFRRKLHPSGHQMVSRIGFTNAPQSESIATCDVVVFPAQSRACAVACGPRLCKRLAPDDTWTLTSRASPHQFHRVLKKYIKLAACCLLLAACSLRWAALAGWLRWLRCRSLAALAGCARSLRSLARLLACLLACLLAHARAQASKRASSACLSDHMESKLGTAAANYS